MRRWVGEERKGQEAAVGGGSRDAGRLRIEFLLLDRLDGRGQKLKSWLAPVQALGIQGRKDSGTKRRGLGKTEARRWLVSCRSPDRIPARFLLGGDSKTEALATHAGPNR